MAGPSPFEALEAIDAGLIVLDADQCVTHWNRWFSVASGIEPPAGRTRRLPELFPDADLARLSTALASCLATGASALMTHALHGPILPLKTRSGSPLVHNLTIHPIGEQPYARCLLQVTDVTAHVRRERVLRDRQNARYQALFEGAFDPIVTVDQDGMIQLANSAAAREWDVAKDHFVGRQMTSLFHDPPAWQAFWENALIGEMPARPAELRIRRSDGAVSYAEVSAARWLSASGTFVTAILRNTNERRIAQQAVRALNAELEARVVQATADNERLSELQERQEVLVRELQHRTRNLIAMVGSIAKQTLAASPSPEAFAARFGERLAALSRVQGLLSRSTEAPISMAALVEMEIDALAGDIHNRIVLDGPDIGLRNSAVETLALALHELATNARKHGALSYEGGSLSVTWQVRDAEPAGPTLALEWREDGVPTKPDLRTVERRGYGRELIETALPYTLGAKTSLRIGDGAVTCTIEIPLAMAQRVAKGS